MALRCVRKGAEIVELLQTGFQLDYDRKMGFRLHRL